MLSTTGLVRHGTTRPFFQANYRVSPQRIWTLITPTLEVVQLHPRSPFLNLRFSMQFLPLPSLRSLDIVIPSRN